MRQVGRRRLWRLVGVLIVLGVVGGLLLAAYFSPMLSVRSLEVRGAAVSAGGARPDSGVVVPREEIVAVADVPLGTPLLQVDTAAVAQRVARIPVVESVRVDRKYPSTLVIEVRERQPSAVIDTADGQIGVMDGHGVVYAVFASRAAMDAATAKDPRYRSLPLLVVENPGPEDPTSQAGLEVAASLPDWLRPQVESISAASPADVQLALTKDRTVVWGGSDRGADKAEALRHLLKLPGTTFNVSSPDYPAVS